MGESIPLISGHHGSLSHSWVTNELHLQCRPSTQIPRYPWGLPCYVGTWLPDTTGTKMTHLISFQNICKHLVPLSQASPSWPHNLRLFLLFCTYLPLLMAGAVQSIRLHLPASLTPTFGHVLEFQPMGSEQKKQFSDLPSIIHFSFPPRRAKWREYCRPPG